MDSFIKWVKPTLKEGFKLILSSHEKNGRTKRKFFRTNVSTILAIALPFVWTPFLLLSLAFCTVSFMPLNFKLTLLPEYKGDVSDEPEDIGFKIHFRGFKF